VKAGDLVKFVGSWSPRMGPPFPKVGIVTAVWTNGRTQKISSADVIWDVGIEGNTLAHALEVISESR
jgi:hypothetical protein